MRYCPLFGLEEGAFLPYLPSKFSGEVEGHENASRDWKFLDSLRPITALKCVFWTYFLFELICDVHLIDVLDVLFG